MKVEVVTVCSRIPTEAYYHYSEFLASLSRFLVTPTVLGLDSDWHGLMTKPFLLRDWLRAGNNTTDRLIVCDAWDIVFAHNPDMIAGQCTDLFGDAVVFNGEKGCWPRADLAEHFPDDGSLWRYLNSGFMCGPADKILALLENMDMESIGVDRKDDDGRSIEPNDQGEYQAAFVRQPVPMVVDTQCQVSQTLSACELHEFDLSWSNIRNKKTDTHPGVFHFNGSSKNEIMPAFLAKWGL